MANGTNMPTEQVQPNIVARYVGNDTVTATIAVAPGLIGPWSYTTGIPNSRTDIVAPPAQYLAVAGWAA